MLDDTLLSINRRIVRNESQDINDFIARYGWEMSVSATGLRYNIYQKGAGPAAKKGQIAVIAYTLRLLDGSEIDRTLPDAPKEFVIGHGGVESGLEEAILMLHQGDRARFILPSYLAFGLLGDQDKIPPRAALVYDIHLTDLKNIPGR